MKKIFAIITAFSIFAQMGITAIADNTAVYVSPNGQNTGAGTEADPVNSLEKAKELAKTKSASEIIFTAGTYKITNTVNFDSSDVGTYRADGEVIFSGAEKLNSAEFKQVSDPEVLTAIPKNARTKVLEYDLSKNGIRYSVNDNVIPYLYVDDIMQTTARYPNDEHLIAETANGGNSFTYTDYNVSKWQNADDAVIVGRFPYTYYWRNWNMSVAGSTITVTDNKSDTKEIVRKDAEFYVENLIEELDAPGEYYVDRNKNMLYYYPAGDISSKTIEITAFLGDAIKMTNAGNITFDGITFDKIGGNAFDISGADNINIQNCTIKNIQGDDAIYLTGTNSTISDNIFYSCANNVVEIHGGDVRNLTPGNIEVTNNKISMCGFREKNTVIRSGNAATLRTYDYMNKINNNLIQDCMTFMGIECNAYDYEIKYNEIINQGYLIGDGGAIYMGRSTTKYGTEVAYNYIHDGHKGENSYAYCGLYSDDANAGGNFHHNIVKDMYQGFITGVGMNTKINNNLLINNSTKAGVGSRLTSWTKEGGAVEHKFATELKTEAKNIKNDTNYTQAFWNKYTQITDALDRSNNKGYPYLAPWDIEITGNVFVGGEQGMGRATHLYYKQDGTTTAVTGEKEYIEYKNYQPEQGQKYIGSELVSGYWVDDIELYGKEITDTSEKDLNGTDLGNPVIENYSDSYFNNPAKQDYTLTDTLINQVSSVSEVSDINSHIAMMSIYNSTNTDIDAQPESVNLTSPKTGETNVDNKVIFVWDRVPDASKYRIVVSENSNLSDPIHDETFHDTSNALMKEYTLDASTEYYWQVTAYGLAKNNSFEITSNIASFTTKSSSYVDKGNLEYAVTLLDKELSEYEAGNVMYKDKTLPTQMKNAKTNAESLISGSATQSAVDTAETNILSLLVSAENEQYKADEIFTVAFLGGSLTAGGAEWINATKDVLEQKMPGKAIKTFNAGKGGTNSQFGAARFSEDIAKLAPDMVFVDFAVNDTGDTEVNSKIYMESIVRQCKQLEKEPIVIFLYTPYPVEKDSETHTKWLNGVNWKEEIAEHYGIKSINVYDYMQEDYENIKAKENYTSFMDYIADLSYISSGTGYDVHGGYEKYAEAVVKAFNDDYEGCMSPMKDVGIYCKENRSNIEVDYNQIQANSERITYEGEWKLYTDANPFSTDDGNIDISNSYYSYPYFSNGIKQTTSSGAEFSFTTSADYISLNHISATAGSSAKVYIDDDSGNTMTCYSQYGVKNYMGNWIALPGDGEEHTIRVVVDAPTSEKYVFRFGSIIERTSKTAKIVRCFADPETDKVQITATGFDSNAQVSIMVTNPNYDKSQAAANFDLTTVQYANTINANVDGDISFEFSTLVNDEDRSGNYRIYMGTTNGMILEKTYNYGIISVGEVSCKDGNNDISDLSQCAGKTITMSCPIENNTSQEITPAVITALYADGRLANAYLEENVSVGAGEKNNVTWKINLPDSLNGINLAKVMFMDSVNTLKPLSKVRVIYEVK